MSKKIVSLLFGVLVACICTTSAQERGMYIPLNVQKSIQAGVRTADGMPGPAYWQNSSDYVISAMFDPASRTVTGNVQIRYSNASPDTLKQIVVRLYQDIMKKGARRDFQINEKDLTDGVSVTKLEVNGVPVELSGKDAPVRRIGTNMFVRLSEPLAPKTVLALSAEWSVIIPRYSTIRMGQFDSTSFFVAYWYPQIAVYDDIDGWDTNDYTGETEFYNDFCNYDVTLTMPKGFLVWATGVLQNPEETYASGVLERYRLAMQSDTVVRIVTAEDFEKGAVTAGGEQVTWKFNAENVTDFAFATSPHYLWDASRTTLDQKTGRTTFISAAYNRNSKDFYEVAQIARDAILYFSTRMPAVPYPYPSMTVFNGIGGMEFPMMVNDGSTPNRTAAAGLTSHEIAHTYFPFYMGINERKYAWMDEGWAVMLPLAFQQENGGKPIENNIRGFERMAGNDDEMPMIIPSNLLRNNSYRMASYARPGLAYEYLRDVLGTEKFVQALQFYIKNWNGKHPIPYDFFNSFETALKTDLDWFWTPWFLERAFPDPAVTGVKAGKTEATVGVENKGGLPVPLNVVVKYETVPSDTVWYSAEVWKSNRFKTQVKVPIHAKPVEIEIGHPRVPDVDSTNNKYAVK